MLAALLVIGTTTPSDIKDLIVGDLGAGALVGIFVVSILLGRLVPSRHLKDAREERDYWRTAAEVSRAQVDKLVDKDDAVLTILRSLDVYRTKASSGPATEVERT